MHKLEESKVAAAESATVAASRTRSVRARGKDATTRFVDLFGPVVSSGAVLPKSGTFQIERVPLLYRARHCAAGLGDVPLSVSGVCAAFRTSSNHSCQRARELIDARCHICDTLTILIFSSTEHQDLTRQRFNVHHPSLSLEIKKVEFTFKSGSSSCCCSPEWQAYCRERRVSRQTTGQKGKDRSPVASSRILSLDTDDEYSYNVDSDASINDEGEVKLPPDIQVSGDAYTKKFVT